MANEYSIEIHNYITMKIEAAQKAIELAEDQSPYHQGQLEELYWIRKYLKENIDLNTFTYY